jgi:hypothetical protein
VSAGFTINQAFLFGTTLYILFASLMVALTLLLSPRVNRIANMTLSVIYAVTIVGATIGEWSYWILGSAVEVGLLGAIVYYAWTWPKGDYSAPSRQT